MKISMKYAGIEDLQKELKKMSKEKAMKVKGEVYASGLNIQRKAKQNLKGKKSWDTGNLANTIMSEMTGNGVTAEVGPTAPYGPYVEHGTKKHFPPPDALEEWAKRHGFDSAWPICKAISERDTPAKPYLLPAYLAVEDEFYKRLKEILK